MNAKVRVWFEFPILEKSLALPWCTLLEGDGTVSQHTWDCTLSTAINLLRVIAWLNEVPRSTTPQSHFAGLAA